MIAYRRANRQYVAMAEGDVWDFLDEQKVMTVAFVADDGYPHLTPVWYVVSDHALYFRANTNKAKAKLADGALVSCSVDAGRVFTELRGVMVRGQSTIVSDLSRIEEYNTLKAEKYAGMSSDYLDMPDEWRAERSLEHHVIVQISPHSISSWDNRKLAAQPHI